MRRIAFFLVAASLAAAAALAGTVEVDFNPKAEFERFKTWAWAPGRDQGRTGVLHDATMRDRVEKAIAGCLEDAGLRPAGANETPDLLVRYGGDIGTGKTITTSEGKYQDGLAPEYRTLRFEEQVASMIVDLIEASSQTVAWRLYVNQKVAGPYDDPNKFRDAVEKGFSKYPPSPSARAKKLKAIEKSKTR